MRLRSSESSDVGNLACDNYTICGEWVAGQGTEAATLARARARGWHIYEGQTHGGKDVRWVLGPFCVGARGRLAPAPRVLDGQGELF